MPIRPEWRHHYRGPEWAARRKRILERAGDKCEQCGVPNACLVMRARDRSGRWAMQSAKSRKRWQWYDCTGAPCAAPDAATDCSVVAIVITIAHRDHNPTNNSDDNLAAWCQRCHLIHDSRFHRTTRNLRHDAEVGQTRMSYEETPP